MARTQGSHSDITGPRIREAAERLFARKGYAAVSMREIAREVGVQAGALYNYTPDKQTLLFTLLKGHMDAMITAWLVYDPGTTPTARLEAFCRFHIDYNLPHPDAVFISYMELRNLTEENHTIVEGLRNRYEGYLGAILQEGADAGVFHCEDTKIATLGILTMLTGVMSWFRPGGRLAQGQVEDLYWGMVRDIVGVNPPT